MPLSPLDRWLLATLAGGGLLLLVVFVVAVSLRQPARRTRWSEWGVLAAVALSLASLAPAWLVVSVPVEVAAPAPPPPPAVIEPAEPIVWVWVEELPAAAVVAPAVAAPVAPPDPPPLDVPGLLASGLLLAYAAGAAYFALRWLVGVIGLARLLRSCRPVPAWVETAARALHPGVRVLCSPRVEVPFSCGVVRPTVVLPAGLAERATADELNWVLVHEAAHLRHGDPRSYWLLSLAAIVFYPFPWFWGLRSRWRLDQEYLADAEAAVLGPPVAYAEFLLQWATRPRCRHVPAGAVGVLGRSSDLSRRITMLLGEKPAVESRCPRLWSAVVGPALLAVAILTAGVGFQAVAAPVPEDKKGEPKKDEPKKPAQPNLPLIPNFPNFPDLEQILPPDLPIDPDQLKQLQDEMKRVRDQARQEIEKARLRMQGGGLRIQPGIQLQNVPLRALGRPVQGDGRLGAQVASPTDTLVEQLDLPRGMGLVLEQVEDGSAAAKAGLKAHDILLEIAGKPVTSSPEDLVAQLKDVKVDEAVDAVVLRKGKKETVKGVKLPEAKPVQVLPGRNLRPIQINPIQVQPGQVLPFNPIQLNPIQVQPGQFNPFQVVPGGAATTLAVSRNGDGFTTQYSEGGVAMKLTGTVADGKGTLTAAEITENGATTKYETLDKVPETHRAKVKELVEMSASGNVKIIR